MRKLTFSNGFLGFLIIINLLPILAPVILHLGWIGPAKVIYFIYSFFCHQIDWRSIHIYDFQVAWCARDTAIWGGILIVSLFLKFTGVKGLKWYHCIPLMIPMALDGGIQTIATVLGLYQGPLYVSTNLVRAITGSLFGIGLGAVLFPVIDTFEQKRLESKTYVLKKIKKTLTFTTNRIILVSFITVMLSYFVLIQMWQITSTRVNPSNILDSAEKFPTVDGTIIVRRKDGICPVTIGGAQNYSVGSLLATQCFFPDKN